MKKANSIGKKIIVPIVLAAVLGVGGGVTAIMLNKPTTASDTKKNTLEVKYGNYYLNGDKNSGMYFELTENYLALRYDGIDIYAATKDACIKDGNAEKIAEDESRRLVDDYTKENPYVVSVFGTKTTPYQLMIHWTGEGIEREGGTVYSGTGFRYNGYDTINCSPLGDFILVEE